MSERKPSDDGFEQWCLSIQLDPNSWVGKANRQVWEAAQFALNSELGIAANEAAKAERLVVFMTKIRRMDMVPLPESLILQAAKELLG